MHRIQFPTKSKRERFVFVCRVSLGERLQYEESSGVIRSTGSSSGEKEITFQVKKVKKVHQFNVTGLNFFYRFS